MITYSITFLVATLCLMPGGSQGQECDSDEVEKTKLAFCAFEPGDLGTVCTNLTGGALPTPLSVLPILAFPANAVCFIRIVGDRLVAVGNAQTCAALVIICAEDTGQGSGDEEEVEFMFRELTVTGLQRLANLPELPPASVLPP